jgi:hypothetical protein
VYFICPSLPDETLYGCFFYLAVDKKEFHKNTYDNLKCKNSFNFTLKLPCRKCKILNVREIFVFSFIVSESTLLLRCLISSNDLPCEVKPISFLSSPIFCPMVAKADEIWLTTLNLNTGSFSKTEVIKPNLNILEKFHITTHQNI